MSSPLEISINALVESLRSSRNSPSAYHGMVSQHAGFASYAAGGVAGAAPSGIGRALAAAAIPLALFTREMMRASRTLREANDLQAAGARRSNYGLVGRSQWLSQNQREQFQRTISRHQNTIARAYGASNVAAAIRNPNAFAARARRNLARADAAMRRAARKTSTTTNLALFRANRDRTRARAAHAAAVAHVRHLRTVVTSPARMQAAVRDVQRARGVYNKANASYKKLRAKYVGAYRQSVKTLRAAAAALNRSNAATKAVRGVGRATRAASGAGAAAARAAGSTAIAAGVVGGAAVALAALAVVSYKTARTIAEMGDRTRDYSEGVYKTNVQLTLFSANLARQHAFNAVASVNRTMGMARATEGSGAALAKSINEMRGAWYQSDVHSRDLSNKFANIAAQLSAGAGNAWGPFMGKLNSLFDRNAGHLAAKGAGGAPSLAEDFGFFFTKNMTDAMDYAVDKAIDIGNAFVKVENGMIDIANMFAGIFGGPKVKHADPFQKADPNAGKPIKPPGPVEDPIAGMIRGMNDAWKARGGNVMRPGAVPPPLPQLPKFP